MRMSGKGTLVLAAAICCGFLLFANTCVASGDVTTGGERYRKEHLGFSVADEEEYTANLVEQGLQLHVPYHFKLVKVSFSFSQPFPPCPWVLVLEKEFRVAFLTRSNERSLFICLCVVVFSSLDPKP